MNSSTSQGILPDKHGYMVVPLYFSLLPLQQLYLLSPMLNARSPIAFKIRVFFTSWSCHSHCHLVVCINQTVIKLMENPLRI